MKSRIGKLNLHERNGWLVRIDGKMKYAGKNIKTQEEAELWLAKLRVELSESDDGPIAPEDQPITALVATHLDRVSGQGSIKNFNDKKRILDRFAAKYGTTTVRKLTPLDIEDFIQSSAKRTSGGGKRNVYGHLRCLFNWCKSRLKMTEDPMTGLKAPPANVRSEEYVISQFEWNGILTHLGSLYRDVAEVLWYSGARPSEIITATIHEWDATTRVLNKKHHKNRHKGKERPILIPSVAAEIIRKHIGERKTGYIFPNKKNKPICEQWLCESIQNIAKDNGRIKPICLYSTRHSFAVQHLERGIPIHTVAAWLGHTVAVCEKHYGHTIARLENTMALLEAN